MGSFFGGLSSRRAAEAAVKSAKKQEDSLRRLYEAEIKAAQCNAQAYYNQHMRRWEYDRHLSGRTTPQPEPQGKQCGGCGSRQYLNHNGQIICAYCRSWA